MSISFDEKCFKCGKNLIFDKYGDRLSEVLHHCPQCGIYLCNSCFETMKDTQNTVCPNCGKDQIKNKL